MQGTKMQKKWAFAEKRISADFILTVFDILCKFTIFIDSVDGVFLF